jgi:hypothetical protein
MAHRQLYESPNGDRWYLHRDSRGKVLVAHQANSASGGTVSLIELSTFLLPKNQGPEHQALRSLIGSLAESETETAENKTEPKPEIAQSLDFKA